MDNKTSNHPENAESGQQNCATCKYYARRKDGYPEGLCTYNRSESFGMFKRYNCFCGRYEPIEAEQQHMHKIAYNDCYGGFGLSRAAILWLGSHGIYDKYPGIEELNDLPRHEPLLIRCIEELGEDVNDGKCNKIRIAEIDSDMYYIENYDGKEYIITPKDMTKIEQ